MNDSGHTECKEHGRQLRAATSPKIASAIRGKEKVASNEVIEYEIKNCFDDPQRSHTYLVDVDFMRSFIDTSAHSKVTLVDRDRGRKRLNDRLLIFRIGEHMESVCPRCLELATGRPAPLPGWLKSTP
jgi:hypothetical protein